jgi:hypothetical protein
MKHVSQSPYGDFPEYNDHTASQVEIARPITETPQNLRQLDALLETGFSWDEAKKLLELREHIYENSEMRQRLTSDSRLQFARWLYLHGELHE